MVSSTLMDQLIVRRFHISTTYHSVRGERERERTELPTTQDEGQQEHNFHDKFIRSRNGEKTSDKQGRGSIGG
jgi:hypothetical protein